MNKYDNFLKKINNFFREIFKIWIFMENKLIKI